MSDAKARWEAWNHGGGPRYPHEKVIQFTFRSFPAERRRGSRALDLGSGCGVHTLFLAHEGFAVTGVDIAQSGVDETRRRLDTAGLTADLLCRPIQDAELGRDQFDLVISSGVLDCAGVDAAHAALQRVRGAMRRDGYGMFLFASDRDFRVRGDNALRLHGFTRAEVDACFAVGFPEVFVDRYITTYRGGESEQNDWLVTVRG